MSDTPQLLALMRETREMKAYECVKQFESLARKLEKENAALREKFMFIESEIILLRVERDELREALKPFRDYAIQHGPMNLHGRNSALITVKHWQRAIYPSGEEQP